MGRYWLYLCLAVVWVPFGCSNLRDDVPTVSKSFHPSGWLAQGTEDFHGAFIRNTEWDLNQCKSCHGDDYAGGKANVSCITCHEATPEDCVVCHGGQDNQTGAPPRDLDGNTAVTSVAVGSHSAHLSGEEVSDGIACESCHLVPATFDSPGHADSMLPAELTFSGLATTDSAAPQWDEGAATCSNAYCHGAWRLSKAESNFASFYTGEEMTGNSAAPTWTDPESAACGSCHGLPPTGHLPFEITACSSCHATVIDASGTIIDKSKHIDGNINVFGQEVPMR